MQFRTLMRIGPVPQVIVHAAEALDADLIVMATHGRTALAHALLGSVTEKVVRSAGCPVLTVRWKKKRARRRRTALTAVKK